MRSTDFIDALDSPQESWGRQYKKIRQLRTGKEEDTEELNEDLDAIAEQFEEIVDEHTQVMHNTFAKMVREKTSIRENADAVIFELMQLTTVEAFLKRLDPRYNDIPTGALIKKKADDILLKFLRCYYRRQPREDIEVESCYGLASPDPDPCKLLEIQEMEEHIQASLSEKEQALFELVMEQASSKEVAERFNITITNATTKVNRLREKIQHRLDELL